MQNRNFSNLAYLAYLATLLLLLFGLMLLAGSRWFHQGPLLEQVKSKGELVVVMQLPPSAVQHSATGPVGLEHDLIQAFADAMGVGVRLVLARNATEVHQALATGQAQMGATRLTVPTTPRNGIRYTEPYLHVESQLIYRYGNTKPDDLKQLAEDAEIVGLAAGGAHAEQLQSLESRIQGLNLVSFDLYADELLYMVWNRELNYAIVDAHELLLNQRYYPELRVAFTLEDGDALAWAFAEAEDSTLFDAAEAFLAANRNQADSKLGQLREQYYGHLSSFDYVGVRTFLRHITERLPTYRPIFEQVAQTHALDWRLLAALSYQESHWNPEAVSPTGVRGMMMLTLVTAKELGVNRLDPQQSIEGGARYLRSLRDRFPERIKEPIRSWLALAAYNVGMGHVQDARKLTDSQGRNPDNWTDIADHLKLLSDPEWHSKTRYGYARGSEPVIYVTRIRSYYDLLVRVTDFPEQNNGQDDLSSPRTFQQLEVLRAPMGIMGNSAL